MIQIGLFRNRGAIPWMIKKQTRSEYSHAAFVLGDGRCIEAWHKPIKLFYNGGRVRVGQLRELHQGGEVDLFTVTINPTLEPQIEEWALSQVGKLYDFTSVLRFVTRRQETRRSSGKFFCSELVFAGYKKFGIELLERTEPWEVSPGLLSKSPYLDFIRTVDLSPPSQIHELTTAAI